MPRSRATPWLLLAALGGCFSGCSSSDSDDPHCTAYCQARAAKGYAGDQSLCMLGCNVAHQVAPSQGQCQAAYVNLSNCQNDPSILSLGCAPSETALDTVCQDQTAAFNACVRARDGT